MPPTTFPGSKDSYVPGSSVLESLQRYKKKRNKFPDNSLFNHIGQIKIGLCPCEGVFFTALSGREKDPRLTMRELPCLMLDTVKYPDDYIVSMIIY